MSWESVSPDLRAIIERVCTPKEVEVLKLRAVGFGWRRIANILGLSDSAVKGRGRNAERKVRQEVAAQRGIWP